MVAVVPDIKSAPEGLKDLVGDVLFPALIEYSQEGEGYSVDRSVAFCSVVNAWSVMMLGDYFRESGGVERGLSELRNLTEQVINEIRAHHKSRLH